MTDQPKWTPGPWAVEPETEGSGQRVCAPDGEYVATGYGRFSLDPVGKANARLIAAAPDLYAALEAAMAFIESHVADPDITDEMIRNYRALQDLRPRDVLAKANPQPKETP